MPKRKNTNKQNQKNIAKQRISKLFIMAEKVAHSGRLNLADRYIEIARKISMRNLVPIPKEFKRRYCKHCYRYMLPGESCIVRISRKKIITRCFYCKKTMRFPIK